MQLYIYLNKKNIFLNPHIMPLTTMKNKNNYFPFLYIISLVKFKKTNLITFRHDHYLNKYIYF